MISGFCKGARWSILLSPMSAPIFIERQSLREPTYGYRNNIARSDDQCHSFLRQLSRRHMYLRDRVRSSLLRRVDP